MIKVTIYTQNYFTISFWLIFVFATIVPKTLPAQSISLTGKASAEALISNSTRQPFYFWANQLGQVSALEQVNFFTHLSVLSVYTLSKPSQSFFAGGNVNIKQTKSASFNIPEIYGGFSAKYFQITGGLFADSLRMYGMSPSNSNFFVTRNATPHPRVRLGSNGFLQLFQKNIFVAGIFEEGILNDKRFVHNARLHHKNLYLRLGSPQKTEFTVGLDHFVFWGGNTETESYHASLKEYIKTILGGSYYSEHLGFRNTIGNHLGQYQVKFKKAFQNSTATIQISHIFEDASGIGWVNYPDNIYTLLIENKNRLFSHLLFEYTYTRNQSGPATNPKTGKPRPVSGDNYFSHSQYQSGLTYNGFFIGNPLFGPIMFTDDGISKGPENNQFSAVHAGFSGEILPALQYKLLVTHSQNYGRQSSKYDPVRNQFFSLLSLKYIFLKKQNMFLETNLAFDQGSLWTGSSANVAGLGVKVGVVF